MHGRRVPRRPALTALLLVPLLVTGCTGPEPEPEPSLEPSPTSSLGTVAKAEVGDRLTVTAAVERIITDTAFVVRDADLTGGTLLVLSAGTSPPAPPQLVTVEGTVIRFSHRELTDRYRLGPPGAYRDFEGGPAVTAETVRVWR